MQIFFTNILHQLQIPIITTYISRRLNYLQRIKNVFTIIKHYGIVIQANYILKSSDYIKIGGKHIDT